MQFVNAQNAIILNKLDFFSKKYYNMCNYIGGINNEMGLARTTH